MYQGRRNFRSGPFGVGSRSLLFAAGAAMTYREAWLVLGLGRHRRRARSWASLPPAGSTGNSIRAWLEQLTKE